MCAEYHTGEERDYKHFSRLRRNTLKFDVRCGHDAYVALTTGGAETDDMYEVIIGGWGNTKSTIRKNRADDLVAVETPDIVCDSEMKPFWIRLKPRRGKIFVGRGGEAAPFMTMQDPDFVRVNHYSVSTGWGSEGDWVIPGEDEFSSSSSSSSDDDDDEVRKMHKKMKSEPRFRQPARWRWARDGEVPENAVVSGEGNEGIEYVGRAEHDGALVIGRVVRDHRVCYVPLNGEEIPKDDYQVLVNSGYSHLEWVPASEGHVPTGGMQGGHNQSKDPLFIARADHDGLKLCGQMNPEYKTVYYPYGGSEHTSHDYEVLVCNAIKLR